MTKDRSHDSSRASHHEEDRNEYFQRKFGYELAYPQADTHEQEREEAEKRLSNG